MSTKFDSCDYLPNCPARHINKASPTKGDECQECNDFEFSSKDGKVSTKCLKTDCSTRSRHILKQKPAFVDDCEECEDYKIPDKDFKTC